MATITIENVPESVVETYWTNINYDEIKFQPKKVKKDPTIRLQKLIEDPNNTSYGPMSIEDFISEMKKW
jgi:hypothetical protein